MARRMLIGICLASLGAFGSFAQQSSNQSSEKSNTNLSAGDSQFVTQAAQGGQGEVTLGRMALQKSSAPGVKEFAQKLIDDHTKANQELMSIAQRKGISVPQDLSPDQKSMQDRLSGLSGKQFDQQYVNGEMQDHSKAVDLFRNQSKNGQDPELKAFANKYLPILEQHTQMAHSLSSKIASTGTSGGQSGMMGGKGEQSQSRQSSTTEQQTTTTSRLGRGDQSRQDQNQSTGFTSDQSGERLPRTASPEPVILLFGLLSLAASCLFRVYRYGSR